MPDRRLRSATLAALTLLGALTVLAGATQAHEPRPNDKPASRYEVAEGHDVSLALGGFEGEATLDQEGAYLSVEVGNERPTLIHNVTVVFTGMPAGVEVTVSEAHASAASPERVVHLPHVQAGGTSAFGLGLDTAGAEPGGTDLEAMILFEDANGTRHAATDTLPLSIEGAFGVAGPSSATAALAVVGSALGLALARPR